MANFQGKLNSNKICSAIFNMIISQQVFVDNIKGVHGDLVNKFKTDGTLYGDTKLYYAGDILRSEPWDGTNTNVLETNRPPQPKCQAIVMDQFRNINITVDRYLSKQAWSTEGAFGQFISFVLSCLKETKRVYEATLFNTYIGTHKSTKGAANITLNLPVNADPEVQNRLQAQEIAKGMAKILNRLRDPSRDFNEYNFLRSYDDSDIIAIWNEDVIVDITKLDVPTIFHKEGLVDKLGEYSLPARYFGDILTEPGTGDGTTIRSLVEIDYNTTVDGQGQTVLKKMDAVDYDPAKHIFPGDLIPVGEDYEANEAYKQNDNILFKLVHKNGVPFMSAFEVETSFNNPRALLENHYLTFGYNTIEALYDKPYITVVKNSK